MMLAASIGGPGTLVHVKAGRLRLVSDLLGEAFEAVAPEPHLVVDVLAVAMRRTPVRFFVAFSIGVWLSDARFDDVRRWATSFCCFVVNAVLSTALAAVRSFAVDASGKGF